MKILKIIGKLGKTLLKGAIKEIPIVGGLIYNKAEVNESPAGKINYTQLIGQLIAAGLIIGFMTGKIDATSMNTIQDYATGIFSDTSIPMDTTSIN